NKRPQNVELIEQVNHEELEVYYKKAKVYCQFSRSESFGVAIVEAMNFGCIPVVTNVGGMPEIVENYGFVTKRNVSKISMYILDTIKTRPYLLSDSDKEPALKPFLFSERKQKLLEVVNRLI
ncbi:MAG: glycosyltransferase, partial [Bacteroidales bacterium]|nr:glycosyltransferase [Bacteroidales bacterium]